MGRKKANDGAARFVEELFPEANDVKKKYYEKRLVTFSTNRKNGEYRTALKLVERCFITVHDEKRGENGKAISYSRNSHCFFKNLLKVDELLPGKPQKVIAIIQKEGSYEDRASIIEGCFKDLRDRAEQYARFADDVGAIKSNLLGDKNPAKSDLFLLEGAQQGVVAPPAEKNNPRIVSFHGLSPLQRIEYLEREGNLSDAELSAHKAVHYLEAGDIERALEYADNALHADQKNGFAWMVKGTLALDGVREAFNQSVLHQELGANVDAVDSEEQWHQERYEAALDQQELNLKDMVGFYLKAWSYWPDNAATYMLRSYEKKTQLILHFFKYAEHIDFDVELLKKTMARGLEELEFIASFHTTAFLTYVLPVAVRADFEITQKLARYFIKRVRASRPKKDKLNPPDPCTNIDIVRAGENLMHLQALAVVLPFKEVEGFMHDVDRRFKEIDRIARLKNWSAFYLSRLQHLETEDASSVCVAALENIPFLKRTYDQRLYKQWQYLYFRLIVEFSLTGIIGNPSDASAVVADVVDKFITPDLLESISGYVYFTKEIEGDYLDALGEEEVCKDLSGSTYHALHDDIQIVLSKMFMIPLQADWVENILSGEGASFGMGYRFELLRRYMNDLALGMASVGYREYLCKIEESGDAYGDEAECTALEGHTAFSFVLSFLIKNTTKDPDLISRLEDLKSTWEALQREWAK
jgi:tetratricopeptide (TPR) repeat protein